jgi:hypothetical protein
MDSKSELKRLCTLRPLEMAARIYELETQLVTIQDMFSDALQSDLEHGVKWLNENASKEFHEKYPELTQALCRLSEGK